MSIIEQNATEWREEAMKLRAALREIGRIVHTPTKDTMFRGASQHFQSDFDRIRSICKDALPSGMGI